MPAGDLVFFLVVVSHKKRGNASLPLIYQVFRSLAISASTIDEATVILGLLVVGLISNTAIGDGLIVRLNLSLTSQLLLNKSKSVHWIPPVGCFNPVPSGSFRPNGMNDAFRCPTCNLSVERKW